jgi:hypothetical protein
MLIALELEGLVVTVVAVGLRVREMFRLGLATIVDVVTPIGGVVVMKPVAVMPCVGAGNPDAALVPVVAYANAPVGASNPSVNPKPTTIPRISILIIPPWLSPGGRVRGRP